MSSEKICFVIAPIGEPESETRKRSDQILRHVISPAAKECGYKALRADQISEPGIITSQVIQHIVDDPLVIADLTDRNPNVFYELAIRHAIKKPLVQIIKKGEAIPFDVAGTRTIHVDHHDLDSVEEARNEIIKQIKSVEKDASEVDTPISVAIDLQILRQSDNPEQRSLADVVSALSELRAAFLNIEKRLSDPRYILPPEYIESLMKKAAMRSSRSISYLNEIRMLLSKIDDMVSEKNVKSSDKEIIRELQLRLEHLIHRLYMEES